MCAIWVQCVTLELIILCVCVFRTRTDEPVQNEAFLCRVWKTGMCVKTDEMFWVSHGVCVRNQEQNCSQQYGILILWHKASSLHICWRAVNYPACSLFTLFLSLFHYSTDFHQESLKHWDCVCIRSSSEKYRIFQKSCFCWSRRVWCRLHVCHSSAAHRCLMFTAWFTGHTDMT